MDVTLYFRHTNEPQNVEINEETIFDIILKNPRSSLLGLLFLFLLGFFIYNKYIDQPDTAPKEPERRQEKYCNVCELSPKCPSHMNIVA